LADVFISYKREDKARVAAIAKALEEEGFSVWWDPEIPLGESYAVSIRRELEAASTVLPIWSMQSVSSEWVQEEATLGKRKGALVPARIDPVDPPVGFTMTQTADLCGWAGDRTNEEWRRLVEHVAENAKRPARAIPQGYKPPRRFPTAALIAAAVVLVAIAIGAAAWNSGVLRGALPGGSATETAETSPGEIPTLGAAMSFRGADGGVMTAAISPDGRFVATGDAMGSVRFYDASNAVPVGEPRLRVVTGAVAALVWQNNDTVSAFGAGSFASLRREGTTPPPGAFDGDIILAAQAPNSDALALADSEGRVTRPGGFPATLPEGDVAQSLAFDGAGRRLLVGGSAGWFYLFAVGSQDAPQRLPVSGTSPVRAAFMPDGRRIVAATYERLYIGPANEWRAETVLQAPGGGGRNSAFALSRDGRRAAVALDERRIYLWDVQREQVIGHAEVPGGARYLQFLPDGTRLLAAASDGDASMYDVPYAP